MSIYVGQINLFAFNFAPVGFLLCDGSLLPIADYDVLFVLIGTTYGGDGQTTFAVPDLRGRIPLGQGAGAGLSSRTIGEAAGAESVTLAVTHLPAHTHVIDASSTTAALACKLGAGNSRSAVGTVPAIESTGVTMPYSSAAADVAMGGTIAPASTPASGATGGTTPHENMQPFLVLNYCISYTGIFPSQ
jgi:microcystin-dependent protein